MATRLPYLAYEQGFNSFLEKLARGYSFEAINAAMT
jgi:hypothetical protein